jgi:2,4-dienoyl-CoA reductase-like NADH-dependent reductase (Old Yellow Enzyme family)
MEGCDGEPDGRPGKLTARRYERFAGGGAGLVWMEAIAVVPRSGQSAAIVDECRQQVCLAEWSV